jgi:hypothetical protein
MAIAYSLSSFEDSGKCAYSSLEAYHPKMKNPLQIGVKMSNIIDHCKITLDLKTAVAWVIFSTASYTKKIIMIGANAIQR